MLCFGSFLIELPLHHRHFSGTVAIGNASINLDKTAPLDHLRKIVRNVFMHFVTHCSLCILQKIPQKKKEVLAKIYVKNILSNSLVSNLKILLTSLICRYDSAEGKILDSPVDCRPSPNEAPTIG